MQGKQENKNLAIDICYQQNTYSSPNFEPTSLDFSEQCYQYLIIPSLKPILFPHAPGTGFASKTQLMTALHRQQQLCSQKSRRGSGSSEDLNVDPDSDSSKPGPLTITKK